ncbi:hypothetical protein, partial [Amnibacterium endophyticum]
MTDMETMSNGNGASGETLAALMADGRVDAARLQAIGTEVAEALEALHLTGAVHGAVDAETIVL